MLKWYREYTSVLSREFYVLFGASIGVIFGIGFFFFRSYLAPLNQSFYGWIGLLIGAFILGRLIVIGAAFIARKNGKKRPKKVATRSKQEISALRKYRFIVLIPIAVVLLLSASAKMGVLPLSYESMISRIVLIGFMVWLAFYSRKGLPPSNLKKGSLAEKVSNGSYRVLKIAVVVFVLESIISIWIVWKR
jgi:hypothetical protein